MSVENLFIIIGSYRRIWDSTRIKKIKNDCRSPKFITEDKVECKFPVESFAMA